MTAEPILTRQSFLNSIERENDGVVNFDYRRRLV